MIQKVYEIDPLISPGRSYERISAYACPRCGFPVRVLSCMEDPPVVRKILDHLGLGGRPSPGRTYVRIRAYAQARSARSHSDRLYRRRLAAGG